MEYGIREIPRILNVNEHHMALVLLVDTSGSMEGYPIEELNRGINRFKEQVCKDSDTQKILDVAVVEYNDNANLVQDFVPVSYMDNIQLTAGGRTYMSDAIRMAVDMVADRSRFYYRSGTAPYKPWIMLLSDGYNMDDVSDVANEIRQLEATDKLKFFCVGVGDEYDSNTLHRLAGEKVMKLKDYDFSQLFDWIYKSMRSISVSSPGERPQAVSLPENIDKDTTGWF